jgi:uncharacterized membrane protein YfcA
MIALAVIFVAALASSLFGTLIGGSSLVTIPTLMLLGLPPHTAIGTDRLGITGISIAGWYQFHRRGMIDYRIGLCVGIAALCGSFIGANLALQISASTLRIVVAAITVAILPLLIFSPRMGVEKRKPTLRPRDYVIGGALCFLIGIYGGFYGPMAGTFLCYVLIAWFGQTFLESAATFKIGSLFLTTMAASVYASKGAIHYPMAAAMFGGSCIGSYIGVHYADRIGNVWIKRLFVLLILIMIAKLLTQR